MSHTNLSADTVNTTAGATMDAADAALKAKLDAFPSEPTQAQMLDLQRAFQSWTLLVQTLSTCYKELSDAWKGVVQKV